LLIKETGIVFLTCTLKVHGFARVINIYVACLMLLLNAQTLELKKEEREKKRLYAAQEPEKLFKRVKLKTNKIERLKFKFY